MKVSVKGYYTESPLGFVRHYPSFVNRLLMRSMRKTPEQREKELLHMTGEFGIEMELAFEKHLQRLRFNKSCLNFKY